MSMKCNRTMKLLSNYLDRQLSGSECAAVERHLAQCLSCRDELEQLNADRKVLRAVEPPAVPPYFRTRVMAEIRSRTVTRSSSAPVWVRTLAVAATVLVIVGSGFAGLALGSSFARFEHQDSLQREKWGQSASRDSPHFPAGLSPIQEGP